MSESSVDAHRVNHEDLHDFARRAFLHTGIPEEDARVTADILIASDLRGIDSHGVAHLDRYITAIKNGEINPAPDIRIVGETGATATLDGDQGLGFVAGHRGMSVALEKARSAGAGIVTVRTSTHFGPGFYYAAMAIDHDMVGISMTTGGNIVIPPGGRKRTYGANVIAFAAPSRGASPLIVDMSTSVVAGGKFEIAFRRDESVPDGWGLDLEGRPINDPRLFLDGGGLLPLGGSPAMGAWKGFGLALLVDVLCGVLSDGGASVELRKGQANHFFVALDIEAFGSKSAFLDRFDSMSARLKEAPRLPGAGPLTLPGEVEASVESERRRTGIPLDAATDRSLRGVAESLGITYDL